MAALEHNSPSHPNHRFSLVASSAGGTTPTRIGLCPARKPARCWGLSTPIAASFTTLVGWVGGTEACPLLNGLKCNDPALVPFGSGVGSSLSTEHPSDPSYHHIIGGVDEESIRHRRRQSGRALINAGDCAPGTTYVQLNETDAHHCGGGPTCEEWVQAAGWVTAAVDNVGCKESMCVYRACAAACSCFSRDGCNG